MNIEKVIKAAMLTNQEIQKAAFDKVKRDKIIILSLLFSNICSLIALVFEKINGQ